MVSLLESRVSEHDQTDFDGQYMLDKFPNARTFPQIIVDGNHVGGYDDLSKLIGDT